MTKYIVISNDGDTHIDCYTKSTFEKMLNDGDFGSPTFLDEIPENNDPAYWGDQMLVIRGEITPPTAKQVVTKWNVK